MCPIQKSSSTTGILNKSTESGKFTCDDLCGESESYWASVIWGYLAHIKCANIVPGWLWMGLSEPRTWLIVSGFPEVVDRQTSDTSWCRVIRILCTSILKRSRKVNSRSVLVGHLAMSLIVWETERSWFLCICMLFISLQIFAFAKSDFSCVSSD